jgi:hypothetical protein
MVLLLLPTSKDKQIALDQGGCRPTAWCWLLLADDLDAVPGQVLQWKQIRSAKHQQHRSSTYQSAASASRTR